MSSECERCDGCGRIASGEEGAPWTFWENLPLKASMAVVMGLVRPIPCPVCHGTGQVPKEKEAMDG